MTRNGKWHLLNATRSETKEQIRAEIAKVEKVKQDHIRMVKYWAEMQFAQYAAIVYGYDHCGKAESAYNSSILAGNRLMNYYSCSRSHLVTSANEVKDSTGIPLV
jgi:hypothetical protein